MKIIFFNSHVLWPHHTETELELIQNHLNNNDQVFRVGCRGELSICDNNLEHSISKET